MDTPEKKERKAVGIFPRLCFSKTLELLMTIYGLGEGEPVRRRTVFDKLGKSPESGPSRVLIVASGSGYGLTTGSYKAEYLGITDRGKQIASSTDPLLRFEGIYEALFSNEIFSAFVERFNDRGIPIDEVAIEYLRNNHGLSLEDAHSCWGVFKENLMEQNLIQELSGKRVVVSQNAALELLGKPATTISEKASQTKDKNSADENVYQKPETDMLRISGKPGSPLPQFHFNIQVVLPENASPETYETIFRSIAIHLLGRGED